MENQKEHYRRISLFYFRKGKNEKRSGRPVEVDDDLIEAIIDSDRRSTTREIAEKLHENHLKIWLCSKIRYMGSSRTERKAFNATR